MSRIELGLTLGDGFAARLRVGRAQLIEPALQVLPGGGAQVPAWPVRAAGDLERDRFAGERAEHAACRADARLEIARRHHLGDM